MKIKTNDEAWYLSYIFSKSSHPASVTHGYVSQFGEVHQMKIEDTIEDTMICGTVRNTISSNHYSTILVLKYL